MKLITRQPSVLLSPGGFYSDAIIREIRKEGAAKIAKRLKLTQSLVSQWIKGKKALPWATALSIASGARAERFLYMGTKFLRQCAADRLLSGPREEVVFPKDRNDVRRTW